MKKLFYVLLVLLLGASVAYSSPTQLHMEKLFVATETTMGEKDVDDVEMLKVGIFGLGGGLDYTVGEVDFTQMLALVGYEINEFIIPYAVVGSTGIEINRTISGNIAGYSIPLLSTDYDSNGAFTWGVGLKGQLIELPQEIKLGYDVRFMAFDDDEVTTTTLLPGYCGVGLDSTTDVESMEWDFIIKASKRINLVSDTNEDPLIRAITPSVGFKYTDLDLNIKNTISICGDNITAGSEENVKGDMYSAVIGLDVEIGDNWNVGINGVIGGERSVGLLCKYSF